MFFTIRDRFPVCFTYYKIIITFYKINILVNWFSLIPAVVTQWGNSREEKVNY